jgi:hypothetical protein
MKPETREYLLEGVAVFLLLPLVPIVLLWQLFEVAPKLATGIWVAALMWLFYHTGMRA